MKSLHLSPEFLEQLKESWRPRTFLGVMGSYAACAAIATGATLIFFPNALRPAACFASAAYEQTTPAAKAERLAQFSRLLQNLPQLKP